MPSNHLIHESSPYLLQHAHNPVEWYPWGQEALEKAAREDKPILVSIGYSACHWCHVMERESFEDPAVAALMNEHFVNIKIDREERPDLDHIYMEAVQVMTGSGGWPLNVFLTPERKPFWGGTYFPPRAAYNKLSWKDVLQGVNRAYKTHRSQIDLQSENLTGQIIESNSFGLGSPDLEAIQWHPHKEDMTALFDNLMKTADHNSGGFGSAPKFPPVFCIQFLMRHFYFTRDQAALNHALLTLDRMLAGGIYDHLGGGFARYSTDENWIVPHFEKMLYDNALLVTVLAEAYQLTKKDSYREAIVETMDFVQRELLSTEGGFYSALDADSEGVEGKYYVWDKSEIEEILGADAGMFCAYYNVREIANWESANILYRTMTLEDLSALYHGSPDELGQKIASCRKKLLLRRSLRIRPALDDKILLSWNALMIKGCCKAHAATGEDTYKELAVRNFAFLWSRMKGDGIFKFHHTYKDGMAKNPGFLDDYACLIEAMIHLQEITGDPEYLIRARELTVWVMENFQEKEEGYFFYTHKDQKDVILRKKDMYDGAIPSGNALISFNIFFLAIIFDLPDWKELAQNNCRRLSQTVIRYPVSFGVWATLMQWLTYGEVELVMTGKDLSKIRKDFLHNFIPNCVFQSTTEQNDQFPLLKDKPLTGSTLIFLCKDYSCQSPVTELHEIFPLLETHRN
jgi:uncharacterized protein YyaL (SSP411 family)